MKTTISTSILSLFLLSACSGPAEEAVLSCVPDGAGIVGGSSVYSDDEVALKTVGIFIGKSSSSGGICTGTLIAPDVVLTAAHCMEGVKKAYVAFQTTMSCSGFDGKTNGVAVTKMVIHPSYKGTEGKRIAELGGDLAVLKLERSAPSNYPVMKLFSGNLERSKARISKFLLAGYGKTTLSSKEDSGVLRKVYKDSSDVISDAHLIAVNQKDGRGICQGDSGGALLAYIDGEYQVVGVNSAVTASLLAGECRDYSIQMSVPHYANWIERTVRSLR